MSIISHPANSNYRDNFDEVFGKKKRANECRVYNTTCPTPELCKLDDPNAPCVAGQVAEMSDEKTQTLTAYPADRAKRRNGGEICDMWIGPCACGAWHHGADDVLEQPRSESLAKTTHRYCDHQVTTSCANGCQAWMGGSRSGGPDPFGECPRREEPPVHACAGCKRVPQENGRPSLEPWA